MDSTPNNRRARKLFEAKFDPRLKTYSYAGGIVMLTISVVGIVMLPLLQEIHQTLKNIEKKVGK